MTILNYIEEIKECLNKNINIFNVIEKYHISIK